MFFPRFSTLEKYCWDPECKTQEAMMIIKKKKEAEKRKQKKELQARKEGLETITKMVLRVQKHVNFYVRKRDNGKKCISCDTMLVGIKFDAGHLFNAHYHWNVRFNAELNIFGQCVKCNKHMHGNLLQMREGVIERIGLDQYKYLESIAKVTRNFTKPELQEIMDHYKKLSKKL